MEMALDELDAARDWMLCWPQRPAPKSRDLLEMWCADNSLPSPTNGIRARSALNNVTRSPTSWGLKLRDSQRQLGGMKKERIRAVR